MPREIGALFRLLLGKGAKSSSGVVPGVCHSGNGKSDGGGVDGLADRLAGKLHLPTLGNGRSKEVLPAIQTEAMPHDERGGEAAVCHQGIPQILKGLESSDSVRRTQIELTRGLAKEVALQRQKLTCIQREASILNETVRRLETLGETQIACLKALPDHLWAASEAGIQARAGVLSDFLRRSRRSDFLASLVACGCLLVLAGGALLILLA